jgi:putative spermidine/putrescine transport system ATP-binding protein
MTSLTFAHVRKTFGATVALEALDLTLQPGEFVSLLGPSGCGKTTALRIAAGFERPDNGTVSVNGNNITALAAHQRNMGMVFQSYSLFPNLSVQGNVEFGLRTRKIARPQRDSRVGEILELVQLGDLAKRFPHQLSGGQQQRVALARALAIQPEVLLLDEPLSALDAKVRSSLRDEIRRLQTELGITTLFVTHDQEEALADRVGVMSNGRLEQIDSPREIYRRPANAFVAKFVGTMNELPATVTSPTSVTVEGQTISMGGKIEQAVGTSVVFLVRPEDTKLISPHPAPSNVAPEAGRFGGHVIMVSFRGATTVVSVRLTGVERPIWVHTSGSTTDVSAGDAVVVSIDATRAVCDSI